MGSNALKQMNTTLKYILALWRLQHQVFLETLSELSWFNFVGILKAAVCGAAELYCVIMQVVSYIWSTLPVFLCCQGWRDADWGRDQQVLEPIWTGRGNLLMFCNISMITPVCSDVGLNRGSCHALITDLCSMSNYINTDILSEGCLCHSYVSYFLIIIYRTRLLMFCNVLSVNKSHEKKKTISECLPSNRNCVVDYVQLWITTRLQQYGS